MIPDRHIAWINIIAIWLIGWGLASVTAPLHAKPRIVDCRVPLMSNHFVSVEAIGRGIVDE
jgi:hypothetical protein